MITGDINFIFFNFHLIWYSPTKQSNTTYCYMFIKNMQNSRRKRHKKTILQPVLNRRPTSWLSLYWCARGPSGITKKRNGQKERKEKRMKRKEKRKFRMKTINMNFLQRKTIWNKAEPWFKIRYLRIHLNILKSVVSAHNPCFLKDF